MPTTLGDNGGNTKKLDDKALSLGGTRLKHLGNDCDAKMNHKELILE